MNRLCRIFLFFILYPAVLFSACSVQANDQQSPVLIVQQEFHVGDLPGELIGKKIVFLSDLHIYEGNFNSPLIQSLPDVVNSCNPDWIIFGGDVLDKSCSTKNKELMEHIEKWFTRFIAKYRIFAVSGNHDPFDGKTAPYAFFKKLNVRFLNNEAVTDHGLVFGGLKHRLWDKYDPPDVFQSKRSTFRILICHCPKIIDKIPEDCAGLILAGHTHGGLVQLPFIPDGAIVSILKMSHMKYVHGWYSRGNIKMYVSSGIGGVGKSSLRFGLRPELLCLTLKK